MNNGSAIGYGLLALKKLMPLLSEEKLRHFEVLMQHEMDFTTEEEAEDVYRSN